MTAALATAPAAKAQAARAFARALTPAPVRTVAEWAQACRYVADESGSSRPGKWSNATTPFAVEIMDCLDPSHEARVVTLKMAAQLVKSEVILNWLGFTVEQDPVSALLVLPSLDEVRAWNAIKWEPMVQATPTLRAKVFDVVERSHKGSTTNLKRFRGGFLSVVTASASKGLQMRSVKRIACDEIEEFPDETGGRGDPIDQAITRGDAHADLKVLLASTAGELPRCRVTQRYAASDQRRWYVPCPHCAGWFTLEFDRLQACDAGGVLPCPVCGVVLTERDKVALNAAGRWLRCWPLDENRTVTPTEPGPPPPAFPAEDFARFAARGSGGRQPGFHLDQAASPFKSWARLLSEAAEAEAKGTQARKVFRQQKLALAWDPTTDAPDHEALHAWRGRFVRRGVVPAWACLLTGAADVQNDRLEWAAYAWGPDGQGARIDWGEIQGDTLTDAPWAQLARVIAQRWPGEATVPLGFDAFGVDSGGGAGRTAKVYAFCKRSRGVKALKGSSDTRTLPLQAGGQTWTRDAQGKKVTAKIWRVGAHETKKIVYDLLANGLAAAKTDARGPQCLHFSGDTPEEHFKQLTAEVYREAKTRRAGAAGFWEKLPGRANEQLDLAVYAYALAWDQGLERWGAEDWGRLFAARAKPADDLPLLSAQAEAAAAKPAPAGVPGGGPEVDPEPAPDAELGADGNADGNGDGDTNETPARPGAALPENPRPQTLRARFAALAALNSAAKPEGRP